MSETPATLDRTTLILPAFGKIPELRLSMEKIVEAEKRLIEAKTVNPVTYVDLEHCFNESYRDLKRHLSSIGFQLAQADKAMQQAKAEVLLGSYPEYLEKNNLKRYQDTSDLRQSFLMKDESYLAALDRFNQLKALESNLDGKVKVVENVCRYMRKQMDLLIRSGLSNADYYNTIGRKNG